MTVFDRIRQHHGIEHATVTLLSQRIKGAQLVARSDFAGFTVFGEVDTADLAAAAAEALARLQAGERDLAIHPNCGTNLAAAGILSGVAAFVASSGQPVLATPHGPGRRSLWWERLPSAILAATLALLAAPSVGRWLQEHVTTSSQVTGLRIATVARLPDGPVVAHRVTITPTEG
jgi:hypothetical protein